MTSLKPISLKNDYHQMLTTDFSVQFNSVDAMTSSINLDADWSIVPQL